MSTANTYNQTHLILNVPATQVYVSGLPFKVQSMIAESVLYVSCCLVYVRAWTIANDIVVS